MGTDHMFHLILLMGEPFSEAGMQNVLGGALPDDDLL